MGLFLTIIFTCIALNTIVGLISYFRETDRYIDLCYSLGIVVLMLIAFFWRLPYWNGLLHWVQVLLLFSVLLWAVRLGTYLFIRVSLNKTDYRIQMVRRSLVRWWSLWIFQTINMVMITAPFTYAVGMISWAVQSPSEEWTLLLWLLAMFGLLWETVADCQKFIHHQQQSSDNPTLMRTGLWKYSRHPNYFGEILFWLSLTSFFIINSLIQHASWKFCFWLLCPLFHSAMLLYLSGVPMTELHAWQKYHHQPIFDTYIKNTSIVFPWIGKKGISPYLKFYFKKQK